MDDLAVAERAKYERVWAECELYHKHSPGLRHAPEGYAWFTQNECETLIDFGCGDGRAMDWFRAQPDVKRAIGVDIAHRSEHIFRLPLWQTLPDAWHSDFGYSCDVLEHIPTDMVPKVIESMAAATRKAAWVQIALFEDTAGSMGDWGPLHLTVKPLPWWRFALARHFNVVWSTERRRRATFLLTAK